MCEFISKERAMDCVYEAAEHHSKNDEIIDLLYHIRAAIGKEAEITSNLLTYALRALTDTGDTTPCNFCDRCCDYNACPVEDCWLRYLKFMKKAEELN